MKQHSFKVISSSEKCVYQILDLTDTSLVGITESLEFDDKASMDLADLYNLEIKAGDRLCSKVKGYCIYVSFDKKNMTGVELLKNDYYMEVLSQMSEFFLNNVVKNNQEAFIKYTDINEDIEHSNELAVKSKPIVAKTEKSTNQNTVEETKEREGMPLWLRIVLAIGIIAFVVFLFDYIWFVIIFALCAIAFIPEALREKR